MIAPYCFAHSVSADDVLPSVLAFASLVDTAVCCQRCQEGARRVGNCRHDDRESLTRMKRSLSAWRPLSASRWCSQLKTTADGEHVLKAPTSPTEPAATAHRVSRQRECGEIGHLKMQLTSWRTGTKSRKLQLPEEPS